jgi:predicted esterase YcpF (UPF0227 family)
LLDYRKAEMKLEGAKFDIEEGGNHEYQGFDRKI